MGPIGDLHLEELFLGIIALFVILILCGCSMDRQLQNSRKELDMWQEAALKTLRQEDVAKLEREFRAQKRRLHA